MSDCFIVMPITTPEGYVETYGGDEDHFQHVLDCLFLPAINQAGFTPVPPNAEGSEIIQGRIIGRLERAELVLCDMSCLNANVFFELGIRTALNRPVCLVKDDITPKVPFDTGIINYYEYASRLNAWDLQNQVSLLAKHIKASLGGSDKKNSLWRYFGAESTAAPHAAGGDIESKVDLFNLQIEALRRDLSGVGHRQMSALPSLRPDDSQALAPAIRVAKAKAAVEALKATKGDKEAAAERLGISLATLYRLLSVAESGGIPSARQGTDLPSIAI
jgi:hypothetical protein